MLFSHQRRHPLSIPATDKEGKLSTIAFLLDYLCENLMKDTRKELFILDGYLYAPLYPSTSSIPRTASFLWRIGG
jgi:hypothetical protein